LWVLERLIWPINPHDPYPGTSDGKFPADWQYIFEPLETPTYVAANTEKIALGTSVIDMLFHNHGPEIRRKTNHHDNNIRKWIHRFNGHGMDGIVSSRKHSHDALNITDDIENEIVSIASANPRELGLKFSTWSLRVLAGYVMEKKIVGRISHAEIRNVLLKHGIEWRHSRIVLGSKSKGPDYDLKKAY